MTLEISNKRLVFHGKFEDKLSSILILKNVDEKKKLAVKFSSNVYHERICVKPKRALLDPNDEITVNFKYRPSHPQGRDKIRIRSAPMASSFVTLTNFETVWNQSEAFQQVQTTYVDIVHVEDNRVVTFAPEPHDCQSSPSDMMLPSPLNPAEDQLNDAYLMEEDNIADIIVEPDNAIDHDNNNNDDWGGNWGDDAGGNVPAPDENNNMAIIIDENNNTMTDDFHQNNDEWAPVANEAPEVEGHFAVNEWNNQPANEQLGGQHAEEWPAAIEDGNVNHQGNVDDQGAVASWGQENVYANLAVANHDQVIPVENPCIGQEAPFQAQGEFRGNSQWADGGVWGSGDVQGDVIANVPLQNRDISPHQEVPGAYVVAANQPNIFEAFFVMVAILIFGILIGKGLI